MVAGERFHYLDAARALLMALGIPYHVCLIYNPFDHWGVWSPDTSLAAAVLASCVTIFRMPAFFLISGFFSVMALRKAADRGGFLKSRVLRLGIPFVTVALLLNPVQMAANVGTREFYGDRSLTFEALVTTPGDHWVRHLWFLPCLILYCAGLALIWPLVDRHGRRVLAAIEGQAERRFLPLLLAVAALTGVFSLGAAVLPKLIGWNMILGYGVFNLRNALYYLPFFAIGGALYLSPVLLDRFTTFRWPVLLIGASFMIVHVFVWGVDQPAYRVVRAICNTTGGLLIGQALIAALRRVVTRESRPIRRFVDASFSVYLLHQPVIAALGFAFLFVGWWPLFEIAAIVPLTLGISVALHLALAQSDVLLLLFNGRPLPRRAALAAN